MVVSQKTYLELDDAVPSWIEAVVANFFRYPIHVRCTLVGSVRISRPYKQQLNGKTLEFGVPPAWLHVAVPNRCMSLCLAHYPRRPRPSPVSA